MSQPIRHTSPPKIPKLLFAQNPPFTPHSQAEKLYILIPLSTREQGHIMNGINQLHDPEDPTKTWELVAKMLSNAFYNETGRLRLRASRKIHRRDFLLFEEVGWDVDVKEFEREEREEGGEEEKGGRREGEWEVMGKGKGEGEVVLEVDLVQKETRMLWSGYWKVARPVAMEQIRRLVDGLGHLGEDNPV